MILNLIDADFSICQVASLKGVDFDDEYCFVGKTGDETSLVCATDRVPSDALKRDDGWKGFRVSGVLDFSLIGILSKISTALADAGVGIFAISTYNTDYILFKAENLDNAVVTLTNAGYVIE